MQQKSVERLEAILNYLLFNRLPPLVDSPAGRSTGGPVAEHRWSSPPSATKTVKVMQAGTALIHTQQRHFTLVAVYRVVMLTLCSERENREIKRQLYPFLAFIQTRVIRDDFLYSTQQKARWVSYINASPEGC